MNRFFITHKIYAAMIALPLIFAVTPTVFAGDPDFGSAPYPYIIKDQELGQVLTEFGINMKYKMVINAGLTQKVTGAVSTANPREFIDSLCRQYSVDWYYDGLALYFNPESDTVTRFMKLENVPYATLKKELDRQGLSTSRFTIKPAQGNKLISVMGPPRFQEVVGQTLTALSTGKDTSDFKLSAKPTDAPLVIYRGKDSNVIKFGKAE
jgi:type II secretory pathway component GspD/PulD (secretin)